MSERPPFKPRSTTGDQDLDRLLIDAVEATGATQNRDLLFETFVSIAGMGMDGADRLDLKITNTAMKEMRQAFRVFEPYREVPKVTMFGSARTLPADPLYVLARDLAAALAARGWMVVTGAGPGIMAAGLQGAGPDNSMGINISLPFEQSANEFIAKDPKLVTMKYFFTRKLMLIKESDGFVILPGGFGTLDEAFELMTLLQTGKAEPSPMVLLETPGSGYWDTFERFLRDEVAPRGLIDVEDLTLYTITDDVETAAQEILGFYRNYHSLRYVGERLVLRLRSEPTPAEVAALNAEFVDIVRNGQIMAIEPLPAERRSNDHLDLPRIAFHFDRAGYARLRQLIDAVNRLDSAPPEPSTTADSALAGERPRSGAMPDDVLDPSGTGPTDDDLAAAPLDKEA